MSNVPATPSSQPPTAPAPAAKAADPKAQVPAVAESIKTGQPVPVKTEPPKKFKVKVDNQEREVDEAELVNNYQLRQLSDKKRSEAEKSMAEYEKLFKHSQNDPIKFMKALGHDFDKLATSYLAKKAEEAMLDPKDRELQQAREEASQYKKWVEEQKAGQEKARKEQEVAGERAKLHTEIIDAINEAKETLGVPVDEELIIAIAQKMLLQDKKQKPLNAKEALPKAYASTQKWLQGMASKMEGEALTKWLGADVAMKIRKYDLAQLKAKRAATQPQVGNSAVKPQEQRKEVKQAPYKTWSQFKAETLDNIK